MSGCFDSGRPGCHGSLCRAAHASLRQLPVIRYPAGDDGRPDLSSAPAEGTVCALISHKSADRDSRLRVPGVTGGGRPLHLTAAAGTLDPAVIAGDRIAVDGKTWLVLSAAFGGGVTAELIPVEEEEE